MTHDNQMSSSQERDLARLEEEVAELKIKEEVCQRTARQYRILVPKLQTDFGTTYASLNEMAQTLGAARKEHELSRDKRSRLRSKIRDLEARQEAESRAARKATTNIAELRRDYDATSRNFERLKREVRADGDALRDLEREVKDLESGIAREEGKRSPDPYMLSILERNYYQKREKFNKKRSDLDEQSRQMEREGRRLDALKLRMDAAQPASADAQKLSDELERKRRKLEALEQDVRKSEDALRTAESAMTQARARHQGAGLIEELNLLIGVLRSERDTAEGQRIPKEQRLKDKKDDLRRQQQGDLRRQVGELRRQIEELREEKNQAGRANAQRVQKVRDLVAELSYCRDSMERYVDPVKRVEVRRTTKQRQEKLEKVYSKLKALVKD